MVAFLVMDTFVTDILGPGCGAQFLVELHLNGPKRVGEFASPRNIRLTYPFFGAGGFFPRVVGFHVDEAYRHFSCVFDRSYSVYHT